MTPLAHWDIRLFVCPSICLFIRLFNARQTYWFPLARLSVHLFFRSTIQLFINSSINLLVRRTIHPSSVHSSICSFILLFDHPSTRLSICQSVRPSIQPFTYPFVRHWFTHVSIFRFMCPSTQASVFVCPSIITFICHSFTSHSVQFPFTHPSIHPSICPSIYPSIRSIV